MENLIRPTTPHWMVILLISLIVVAVVSMIGFIISIVNRNGKLGELSIYGLATSMFSVMGLSMLFTIIGGYMISNPTAYTITKIDDTILVNSKSNWIENSTYNIINHKNGNYYLEDGTHPKNLIKISDDELKQMVSKEYLKGDSE